MTSVPSTLNLPSATRRGGRRVLRKVGRTLAALFGFMVVLGLVGAIYESAAEASDLRAYPPSGQLVDVGGYRLHINCTGTGSPTVVVDAGWGDWSASWSSWVQPTVAKTTRICTYDRAGMGWSEAGPLPRTAKQFAQELHTLLERGGIAGPYVLVGHSMGGLTAQVFAHDYSTDVAGVVLIDSMSPRQAKPSATTTPPPATTRASGASILTLPARVGLLRLFAGPLGFTSGLSPEFQPAYTAFSVTSRSMQTQLDEGTGMPESFLQAGAVASFGDLPLIVLSRGLDQEQDWQVMQTGLLQLSSQSRHMFAERSGHTIQLDQPEAAATAIVQMVAQLRRP
ncbi:MAG TPA: alpha/beta hydrolase [Roseiflexaceae bacterium]|nr:alpha/beta hydrolase [Roseiflexaceae bacterium]